MVYLPSQTSVTRCNKAASKLTNYRSIGVHSSKWFLLVLSLQLPWILFPAAIAPNKSHCKAKCLWTPDHQIYMNVLDIPFQKFGHYYGAAPLPLPCGYKSLYSSKKTLHKIFAVCLWECVLIQPNEHLWGKLFKSTLRRK